MLNFRHEAMQEVLIGLAEEAGSVVWRPADVVGVTPGALPEVSLSNGERITASCANGDGSGSDGGSGAASPRAVRIVE
jgi:hypothetical protein